MTPSQGSPADVGAPRTSVPHGDIRAANEHDRSVHHTCRRQSNRTRPTGPALVARADAPVVAPTCVGGLTTVGTTSASAASTERSSAAPAATICREAGGSLTARRRAPVHTHPSGRSPVDLIAASGRTLRIGGYCDNSAGRQPLVLRRALRLQQHTDRALDLGGALLR